MLYQIIALLYLSKILKNNFKYVLMITLSNSDLSLKFQSYVYKMSLNVIYQLEILS